MAILCGFICSSLKLPCPRFLSCPSADAAILIAGLEAQHTLVSDVLFHPGMLDRKLNGDVHWTLLPTVPLCFPIYAVNKAGVLQIRFNLLCHLDSYTEFRVSQGSCERGSLLWS